MLDINNKPYLRKIGDLGDDWKRAGDPAWGDRAAGSTPYVQWRLGMASWRNLKKDLGLRAPGPPWVILPRPCHRSQTNPSKGSR